MTRNLDFTVLDEMPADQLRQLAVEALTELHITESVRQRDNGSFYWTSCGETLANMAEPQEADA